MPTFSFLPEDLRRGFAAARIVKPETSDFTLKFSESGLTVFAYDKRRFAKVLVSPQSTDARPGWTSDDFYVTADRVSLFESNLTSAVISVNEKSLTVTAEGEGQTRKASLKQRAVRSRRPPVPSIPDLPVVLEAESSVLELMLKHLTCSALVNEKGEQDMRVNQVHFYPESSCAFANANVYATVAFLEGMEVDLSLVSVDLPLIRSFCSKATGRVSIHQDTNRLFVRDVGTGSCLAFSRVSGKKPPLVILDESGFQHSVRIPREPLVQGLNWSAVAMEGTQRLSIGFTQSAGTWELTMSHGTQELTRIPVGDVVGGSFSADFPCRHLASLVQSVEGDVLFCYKHKDSPTLLGIRAADPGRIKSMHYMQSMVVR